MFVKLALLACSLSAALAGWNGPLAGGVPAHQFPAGVSPQSCPNYPNCNNPAVAVGGNAGAWNGGGHAGGWNGGNNGAWNGGNNGAWNGGADNGQWNGGADNGQWNGGHNGGWNGDNNGGWNGGNNGLDSGAYTGDGDYRGEGLAESGAYGNADGGYNNGGYNAGAYNPGPAAGHGAPVPAGVDPSSCPNYPFCH